MILGIGTDLVNIDRIARLLGRYDSRFIDRIFTLAEQQTAHPRTHHAPTYAKRWAAKEATLKALGTGLRAGIRWRDMSVVSLPAGQPTLQLSGGALAQLHALTPHDHSAHIHLSLTDDPPWAHAYVIIEALPHTR